MLLVDQFLSVYDKFGGYLLTCDTLLSIFGKHMQEVFQFSFGKRNIMQVKGQVLVPPRISGMLFSLKQRVPVSCNSYVILIPSFSFI